MGYYFMIDLMTIYLYFLFILLLLYKDNKKGETAIIWFQKKVPQVLYPGTVLRLVHGGSHNTLHFHLLFGGNFGSIIAGLHGAMPTIGLLGP